MVSTAAIAGLGRKFPFASSQQELWAGFFSRHFQDSALAKRLFSSSGITNRHSVVSPLIEDVSQWSTATRMNRYASEALPLARSAVEAALSDAQIQPIDIGMLAVVSCTGYATPGIDMRLASDLKMSKDLDRLFVGHMGCYAALPAMRMAGNYVTANQNPAVVVCVELSSLHIQPPTNDVEQMVAHSLFSDAASAAVIAPTSNAGLEIVDVEVLTDAENASLMTWTITDTGFRMTLSQKVPDVLARHVRPTVDRLLSRNRLHICDIAAWAAHPGGPRILDVIAQELELKPDALGVSRGVLADHGNFSSATILVVLDELQETVDLVTGDYVVALAFGPGLTMYSMLLRQS